MIGKLNKHLIGGQLILKHVQSSNSYCSLKIGVKNI